jgi:Protein of unknown function (DUF3551)
MRPVLFAAAIIGAVCLAGTSAMAENDRWCSQGSGADNCGFVSYEQCSANISGIGGKCMQDARAAATPGDGRDFDRPQPAHVGPVREKAGYTQQGATKQGTIKQGTIKQGSTKQGTIKQGSTKQDATRPDATFRTAATTSVSATPGARTSIPLPDQILLAPPPEFDCEFKAARVDEISGQTGPGTDVALRMKLDYERQCYQQAGMILRDRLRRLQASVGETIKAVDGSGQPAANTGTSTRPGARTAIPLPDQALLTAPPEFNCELTTTSLDDVRAQQQPSPAQTDPSTEIGLRVKLDYERQCYRHTELILRDRLRQLQASVGETIRAAKR